MRVRLSDLGFLLSCVLKANKEFGNLDAERTEAQLRAALNHQVWVDPDVLASALASQAELNAYSQDGLDSEQMGRKLAAENGRKYDTKYRVFQASDRSKK